MGAHSTWFEFLPGYDTLKHNLQFYLGREWTFELFKATHFEITHILSALVVLLFLVVGGAAYRASVSAQGDAALLPPPRFNVRALFEGVGDMVYGLLEGVMGDKNARKYLPFLGSFFVFILFSNLISLIPGFRAPTDTLKTNLALSGLVFVATHILGFKEHGLHYLEQFTGHLPLKSPLVIFVPVLFAIELISHIVRPASLAIRLMANMVADHTVAGIFFALVPLIVPVPFLLLGVFVSVVQAVVFTLMSAAYIGMAVAHEEH
jgi:F-type H+-transporting ATPase subunit a